MILGRARFPILLSTRIFFENKKAGASLPSKSLTFPILPGNTFFYGYYNGY